MHEAKLAARWLIREQNTDTNKAELVTANNYSCLTESSIRRRPEQDIHTSLLLYTPKASLQKRCPIIRSSILPPLQSHVLPAAVAHH
jgi:hypothetical protein